MLIKWTIRSLLGRRSTLSNRFMSSYALTYKEFGDPVKVVQLVQDDACTKDVGSEEVLIQFMAAPVNPADINTIQGVYPVKPNFPAVGGNEGVAKVLKVGSSVNCLKPNDWVIHSNTGVGTWRTHSIVDQDRLIKIDNDIDVVAASQILVNPCTAYRMLKDFVRLEKGSSVIQNGANSSVGLYAIQLAKEWGVKSINVIRERDDADATGKLKDELHSYGADYVVTQTELRNREIMDMIWKKDAIPMPKLALNCVGGQNATDCIRYLDSKGTMVTYGGMSKLPLAIPTGSLIFKDHRFFGYWMSRWNQENARSPERFEMIKDISRLIKERKLRSPKVFEAKLSDYKDVLENAMAGFSGGKYVFIMDQSNQ